MDSVVQRMAWAYDTEALTASFCAERVVVYAGTGNNAGDAIGLAADLGCPVLVRCADAAHRLSPDSLEQWDAERCVFIDSAPAPAEGTLILDGLLGSGAEGELRPAYAALVREMNALRAACPHSLLLAVDIPTGLNADTGEHGGVYAEADATFAIGGVKTGLLADGAEHAVGRLVTIPLPEVGNLPPAPTPTGHAEARVCDAAELRPALPRRPYAMYKNQAGRVAIIAGSAGMTGAARLCSEAALKMGAGLVTLYCLQDAYAVLGAACAPEVMVRPVGSYAEITAPAADTLLIGPGLGRQSAENAAAIRRLVQSFAGSIVLDADGLNLAAAEGWNFDSRFILTPHPGEMRRLAPYAATETRAETARRFLAQHDCTLLYKGARTLIADRNALWYNGSGGPYMANGGQGDALAGVIAALAAQGIPHLRAAALGAYLCGCAAEKAWAEGGYAPAVRASQTIQYLGAGL